MKVEVLIDAKVVCEPSSHVTRWFSTQERKAQALERWAKEFEEFVRDHRSQDPIGLSVERVYESQCSHCGMAWEEDADGPLCCDAAQQEWNAEKAKQ